ncbi:MAG: glycosyltransferase [Candidatus Thorarchaeota archaeon]
MNPKKLSQKADKIITVSKSTKNDLVALYGAPPEKVEVISKKGVCMSDG